MNKINHSVKPYIAPAHEIRAWAIGGITTNALICLYGQAMNFFNSPTKPRLGGDGVNRFLSSGQC